MERKDDFEKRRKHLAKMTDEQLKARFWELADKLVEPLVELAETHTSPSIERSVILRMGFSSLDARIIVDKVREAGLLGKGAGHVVLKLSQQQKTGIEEAGQAIIKGADLSGLFAEEAPNA
ncbi:MAG: ornithine aminomutase subunit alpha [Candidatus Wallbacteria bacterium]|nr:ornithine aminomutase subunit alpha [Candidatus Wallbacteria bacterium]